MRLIDAETLIKQVTKKSYTRSSIDLIKNQPIVKAIPIEWIERYMNNFENNQIAYAKPLCKAIITNWEKENEKQ